ncbi:pyridoxamine 5'-phosphate oxidase [Candidatus Providencia siddallii]|uniref:Pyridoxine/pyridoxamine 5'-phosphate oxidase n=1 Tax=Candidatus Providencia siddallii TaxID=1715285 RepID=A0ABP1CG16_9GAMM
MNKINKITISKIRREYIKNELKRSDLTQNPLILFKKWLTEACELQLTDPTAMCVATVDEKGQPYQRIVLLKHLDETGLIFYTNMNSRKAKHIKKNNKISLHFTWKKLERQVNFIGIAKPLKTMEIFKYYKNRPKNSKISAWASYQSSKISTKTILKNKFLEIKEKFKNKEIPLPSFWGGFRIIFNSVEFWQGGKYRLHDRFLYQLENNNWKIDRLAP